LEVRALADHVDRFLSGTFALAPKRHLESGPKPQGKTQSVRQPVRVILPMVR